MNIETEKYAAALRETALKYCGISSRAHAGEAVPLPLTDDLRVWYSVGVPEGSIPWFAEDLILFSADSLVPNQGGYRFHGITEARLDSWPGEWLVIGEVSGDPLIAHLNRADTPISTAVHGTGKWEPMLLAPNLAAFLHVLALRIEVCCGEFAMDLFDSNEVLRPDVRERLFDIANPVVGSASAEIWAGKSWAW